MIVDDDVYKKRIEICRSCKHLEKKLGIETCKLCGCIMTLKAKLETAYCPDIPPKWLDIWNRKQEVFYEDDED